MTDQVISELSKLYPKVKIPVREYTDFYLDTLKKHVKFQFIDQVLLHLMDLESKVKSIKKYKFDLLDKIISFLKEEGYLNELNNLNLNQLPILSKKSFEDWKEDRYYMSIDLNEANFNVLKDNTSLKFKNYTNWAIFLKTQFDAHPAIYNSKSFRQFVLGNTNPKRLIRLQEAVIHNLLTKSFFTNNTLQIVSVSSDEIILDITDGLVETEIGKNTTEILKAFTTLKTHILVELDLLCKYKFFSVKRVVNFGETVKIKRYFDNNTEEVLYEELYGIPGNRFFLHFRTLILKEKYYLPDLYFENDGFKAQWVLD